MAGRGYLLVTAYVDSTTKVEVRCPKGHELPLLPSQIVRNEGCVKCLNRTKETAAHEFHRTARERGYVVTERYVNDNTKARAVCSQGHEIDLLPVTFVNKGTGCTVCAGQCSATARRKFASSADRRGYEILSEYVGARRKVRMRCPARHEFRTTPSSFTSGTRCGECHPTDDDLRRVLG